MLLIAEMLCIKYLVNFLNVLSSTLKSLELFLLRKPLETKERIVNWQGEKNDLD